MLPHSAFKLVILGKIVFSTSVEALVTLGNQHIEAAVLEKSCSSTP
jgi:hypothetical protein